ncbi:hypothetical protein CEUSTIGMA_g9879.t1 [Chlamydomonas eustigma]|uniref:Uncharacterized protein n=1 Tax=Chlamydomonas eustigma TaxID=1157962 RepID=A0A250XHP9_9CHLO|nr:hypothetical protein CEUSTIGMA_g9879.t1 [Chlamydomonas eustigma]|eukprot:GAX82452.1 hypothetical protein CEUSTIGMA_g9879.t1 [Chlamydomonas eustigma]
MLQLSNYVPFIFAPYRYQLPGGSPFPCNHKGKVYDALGTKVKLIKDSAAILHELAMDLRWMNTQIAYVSRTSHSSWAEACLKLFNILEGVTMYDLAEHKEVARLIILKESIKFPKLVS